MDDAEPRQPADDPAEDSPAETAETIWTLGLRREFGGQVAVRDVTFAVDEATIFGFVGPSGSGKTTTIRMLTGVLEPSDGRLAVLGRDPRLFTPDVRERIGYLPQHFVLYPDLTVQENLNFAASVYGLFHRRQRIRDLLDFVELTDHRKKTAGELSGGMQRRLSLASSLVHDPDLLFLDEPTAGVDPVLRHKFWDHFRELRDDGKTLFVTTQYVGEAAYCDVVGVLAGDGRLVSVDTPAGLRRRAFGGDRLRVRPARPLSSPSLRKLAGSDVARGEPVVHDDGSITIPVEEAGTAAPAVMRWAEREDIRLESVAEDLPSFDDVFVRLMEQQSDGDRPREENREDDREEPDR